MVIRSSLAASWLCILTLGACGSPKEAPLTEIVLVVDTDFAPGQIDEISMTIRGPSGANKVASAKLGAGEAPPPRSLGLVHESGPLSPVEVLVQGRLKGAAVVERQAKLAFLKGRTLVLPMHLVRACIDVKCESTQTCTENACQGITLDPESLDSWSGMKPKLDGSGDPQDGSMPMLDAGNGRDAGRDAGSPDGSMVPVDAGPDSGMCTPTVETCNERDDDCDKVIDNGFDLSSNPTHCGFCGNVCRAQNRFCCAGGCTNKSCP